MVELVVKQVLELELKQLPNQVVKHVLKQVLNQKPSKCSSILLSYYLLILIKLILA
jgi:hypothetical protein